VIYYADHFKNGPPGFEATAYINAPRLIWIMDKPVLGGNFGMDVIVPFIYSDVKAGGWQDCAFDIWDIYFEPALLAWHGKQYDLGLGYAVWAPTGDVDAPPTPKMSKGFWSNMFTFGGTWYPTEDKTWAISVLNRYEIHSEHESVRITPGHTYSLEWGLSKAVSKTIEVGLVGYYQQQVNRDKGPDVAYDANIFDRVFAVGPEISMFCPKLKLFCSARYEREFGAEDRPEGHNVCLTLTKIW
jgi:hypothetical protein